MELAITIIMVVLLLAGLIVPAVLAVVYHPLCAMVYPVAAVAVCAWSMWLDKRNGNSAN